MVQTSLTHRQSYEPARTAADRSATLSRRRRCWPPRWRCSATARCLLPRAPSRRGPACGRCRAVLSRSARPWSRALCASWRKKWASLRASSASTDTSSASITMRQGRVERHFVLANFVGEWVSGEAQTGPEAGEVRWIDPHEAASLPTTPALPDVLARAARLDGGDAVRILVRQVGACSSCFGFADGLRAAHAQTPKSKARYARAADPARHRVRTRLTRHRCNDYPSCSAR